MISELLIPLAFSVQVLFGGGEPLPAAVGQAAAQVSSTAAVERARTRVSQSLRRLSRQRAAHRSLKRTHEVQLTELDKLKKKRASWSRDRDIRNAKKAAHATSTRLSALSADLRRLTELVESQRRSLVTAIDAELKSGALAGPRHVELINLRTRTVAALPKKTVRKIIIPDAATDNVFDTAELAQQEKLLRQVERQLEREEQQLQDREKRFRRMAKLQRVRGRSDEFGRYDSQGPRRSRVERGGAKTSADDEQPASAGAGNDASESPEAPPQDPSPPPAGEGSGPDFSDGVDRDDVETAPSLEVSAVVLADVVDADTATAMKRADRSLDPRTKAAAAGRARAQVRRKLDNLRRRLQKIRSRTRQLQR